MGLAKEVLDNAIIVDKDKVINENGLRNQKIVNHKILDLAGDFYCQDIEY